MTDEPFRIGPDYLNEVLDAADVKGVTMTKDWRGQLKLDTELSSTEVINLLISGLALLYARLTKARDELARTQEAIIGDEP
jgi:hypothetical protein